MNERSKKCLEVVCLLFLIFLLIAPFLPDFTDEITPAQIEEVAGRCRWMISLWEQDLEFYNKTLGSDDPAVQEIHEFIKTRMNETAEAYNLYILQNAYVFNGAIPNDIYAAIAKIEE